LTRLFERQKTLSVVLLLIMLGFTIFYLRITRGLESVS